MCADESSNNNGSGCSSTMDRTAVNVDAEVSDVEEEGYCDDSRSAPELRMRVKPVGTKNMEGLYKNTDQVSVQIE